MLSLFPAKRERDRVRSLSQGEGTESVSFSSSRGGTAHPFIPKQQQMDKMMNHSSAEAEAETIEPLRYLSKGEAAAIETELLRDYRFGQQQLIEIWGQACALAITKAYPLSSLAKKQPTVLVICGPDQNGSIGLVCARHLRMYEYEPTIYHPQRSLQSLHQDFTVQCEKMDIPSLSYLPTEVQLINDAYNLVIDAMLGPDADCTNIKEPYAGILVTLKQVKIPIASVDVPSGWAVEEANQDGINPELLISLTAPKKCAVSFSGKHFLAGRFLPYDIQKKYELNLPDYPGTDCLVEL